MLACPLCVNILSLLLLCIHYYIIYTLTPTLCVYLVTIMLCVSSCVLPNNLEQSIKAKFHDNLEFYVLFVFFASTEWWMCSRHSMLVKWVIRILQTIKLKRRELWDLFGSLEEFVGGKTGSKSTCQILGSLCGNQRNMVGCWLVGLSVERVVACSVWLNALWKSDLVLRSELYFQIQILDYSFMLGN